jgi:hypothetical protein
MQLKEIKFGVKSIGNINVFKMRFAMSNDDAKLVGDLLSNSGYNIATYSTTKTCKRTYWDEHSILTVGGAINSKQYSEIIELLHTAAYKYQQQQLDIKFYANKK